MDSEVLKKEGSSVVQLQLLLDKELLLRVQGGKAHYKVVGHVPVPQLLASWLQLKLGHIQGSEVPCKVGGLVVWFQFLPHQPLLYSLLHQTNRREGGG